MGSSTSGIDHREHARHNKKVYGYLKRAESDYIDWVITTAFYTSLHFVDHKIFPFSIEIGGQKKKFNSIEEYRHYSGRPNKHSARKKAVKQQLKGCRTAYKELYDLSFTARYHQYKFDNSEFLEKQVEHWLNTIITECDS